MDVPEKVPGDDVKWPAKNGVVVLNAVEGSPVDKAGIGPLDVIVEINREKVETAADFTRITAALKLERVPITFYDATDSKNRIRFRRRTAIVTPITFRDLMKMELVSEKDEATGSTIIKHREDTNDLPDESSVRVEIVKNGDSAVLAMRIVRVGPMEPIGIQDFTFVVDGERIKIDTKPFDVKFEIKRIKSWEWYSTTEPIAKDASEIHKLARALAKAKEAKVFYQSRNYRAEGEVSADDCDRIATVMTVIDMPADK